MHWPHHPDDEPSPRFGGWADDFNTFEDACRFYGCDTPAQLQAEADEDAADSWIGSQDELEARGAAFRPVYLDNEIPF